MTYMNSCAVGCILVMLVQGAISADSTLANCTHEFSHLDVVVTCLGASNLAYADCVWHHWLLSRNIELPQTYPVKNGNHSIMCKTTIKHPEVGKHSIQLTIVSTNLTTPKILGSVQFTIENQTDIHRGNNDLTFTHGNENSSRASLNVTSKQILNSGFETYTLQFATSKKESTLDSDLSFTPVVKVSDITRQDSYKMTSEVYVRNESPNIRIVIIAVASTLTLTVVGVVTLTAIVRRLCSRSSTHTNDAAIVNKTNCKNNYNNIGELHSSKTGLRHELKTQTQDGLSRTVSPDGLVYVSVVIDTQTNRPGVHQTKTRSDPPRTNYTEIDFEATARAKNTTKQ